MRVSLSRQGLYVVFRMGISGARPAVGFKVKLKSQRLFSERYGHRRGKCIGPIYFGTYAPA